MTAPGENLDFGPGKYFEKRVVPVPGLKEAAIDHIKSWPNSGKGVAGMVRQIDFEFQKSKYVVLILRKLNRINLLEIFELPEEQQRLDEYVKEIKKLYKD